jgi:2-oxoisovalerate dehydrogenase E2 component (dihydrolipoyl transacylase)
LSLEHIKMPQLGESVTEGTISKWFVSPEDKVKKYEPLAEIMTDKVTAEIPSSFDGIIKELIAKEGDTLTVGELICTIEIGGDGKEEKKQELHIGISPKIAQTAIPAVNNEKKMRYSPAVLKLSQEHDIDLSQVHGTGADGRITRKDLLKLIETGTVPKAGDEVQQPAKSNLQETFTQMQRIQAMEPTAVKMDTPSPVSSAVGDIEVPVTGVRKAIAANMLRSKLEVPHAWTMVEVDVTKLVEYRNSIKDEFKHNEGFNLTYFAFFVKAISQALKEFPQINSMWAGDKIILKKDINISIAVATEDALFVPVIKNADEKTIKGIAREIDVYAKKAKSGKLTLEDMHGGTFTVNNTGTFGSVQSMGIINYPQAAIVQVESIVKRPVVLNNNMIAIRDIVNLCMSLDHRVLDGLICGRFLQHVKRILENTSKENTSIY